VKIENSITLNASNTKDSKVGNFSSIKINDSEGFPKFRIRKSRQVTTLNVNSYKTNPVSLKIKL
jgi:hypothetical protein